MEKKSPRGLLHRSKVETSHGCTMCAYDKRLNNTEIRKTFSKIMALVGEELVALQSRFNNEEDEEADLENEEMGEDELGEGESEHFEEEDEEEGEEKDEAEADEEGEEKDGEEAEEKDEKEGEEAADEKDEEESKEGDEEEEDMVDIGDVEEKKVASDDETLQVALRKSKSPISTSWVKKSPWIALGKRKGRSELAKKEQLFAICTSSNSDIDAGKEMIVMDEYYLSKQDLECLQPRRWISNSLMSMVAKTLVADQKSKDGRVTRHIFTSDFMEKITPNPWTWSPSVVESQFLPEHIGYNIGDCDFIFGPVVTHGHWCCCVLEPKTLRFYVLDSLVDVWTYCRKGVQTCKSVTEPKKNKKTGDVDGKEFFARGWHSCGIHVITWLQMWDANEHDAEGYTMPLYSNEDLMNVKVGLLWWLITHPRNEKRQEVLSLLRDKSKRKHT